jgi:predicted TIM-barrel fold metal-dependent hydrolase
MGQASEAAPMDKPRIITLEEHYTDREIEGGFGGLDANPLRKILATRLHDLGELRIKDMDEAGIDVQVISHAAPATQKLDPATAAEVTRRVNDRLYETVRANRQRFAAFASLPTPDPKAAADELERTVTKLGFKGAMLNGLTNGTLFLDDKRFWSIFERAQALDVPLYLHPSTPHAAVMDAYFKDYPLLMRSPWSFLIETASAAVRLMMSGVFDAYPRVKVILGHLGEALPFSLWRLDYTHSLFNETAKLKRTFSEYFCEHFYITTSGNFYTPALLCSIMAMGADRIMLSVDWPFNNNKEAVDWLQAAPLSPEDRAKILGGNATRLLKL